MGMAGVAIGRVALPAGLLVRRTLGEAAAVVQVALGGAVVLAAAERPSVLTSSHNGAFTRWFAGPLRGLAPGLTRSQSMVERGLHGVLLAMLAMWLLVLLGGHTVRGGVVIGSVVALNL